MATNKVVLLFDGDQAGRQRLAIRLDPLNFEVHQSDNLEEAKHLTKDKPFDLLIMEWGVGGQSGERILRELDITPSKVCVFTAQPLEKLTAELNRMGIKRIFPKSDRLGLLDYLEKNEQPRPEAPLGSAGVQGLQFLVIDDSSTVRMMLRKVLEERFPGCAVREADDGHQALAEMGHKKVDLILTDLEMPGMNGHDFLARIGSNPILGRKPVIVFSGFITPELHKRYGERTNIRFLQKPCEPSFVANAVEKLLNERKPARV